MVAGDIVFRGGVHTVKSWVEMKMLSGLMEYTVRATYCQRCSDLGIMSLNTKTSLLLPVPSGPLRANGTLATNSYPSERISCNA